MGPVSCRGVTAKLRATSHSKSPAPALYPKRRRKPLSSLGATARRHDGYLSFTSSKTSSHNAAPAGSSSFSTLEAFPHNKVHNYIGGVGPIDPGPYGDMTNFLSPVDPIFYLHHSNMDRLWDIWTRKQMRRGLPYLPSGQDLKAFSDEPFLFYVDGKGAYVGPSKAGGLPQHRRVRL